MQIAQRLYEGVDVGDGAAGLSLMDADTLVRHHLPVVMIVGNNSAWALEKAPMQALYGYDAYKAGLILSPGGIAVMVCMPISGYLLGRRADARYLIFFGALSIGLASYWASLLTLEASPWVLVIRRCAQLFGMGFVFAPVNTAEDIAHDQQLAARDYYQQVEHPGLDRSLTLIGPFAKLSGSPAPATRRAPMLGEHNADILQGDLGLSGAECAALEAAGVIGSAGQGGSVGQIGSMGQVGSVGRGAGR